jgi:hypothetical protein
MIRRCNPAANGKQSDAATTVAAHTAVTPIRVVVHHPVVRFSAPFEQQQPIGANAPPTIAENLCRL